LRIAARDYLLRSLPGYAVWEANATIERSVRDIVTVETPLELNVYGQSSPQLVAIGNDLLMVWLHDDPARSPTNRTEVVFSRYSAAQASWSTPTAVSDDGTAGFHPQLAVLPNGDVLLAWENVSEVLVEPGAPGDPCIAQCASDPDPAQCQIQCKMEEMKGKSEIAVARYNTANGTWGAQTSLTSNGYLDRSPRIATAANGTAMLTWVANAANDPIGSATNPNTVRFAAFDGANWTAPADAATGVPSIIKSAMAFKGTEALMLYSSDTDGDTQTPDDRELYSLIFTAGAWGAPTRLTTDGVEDASPQIVYDASGAPLIAWYSGGDIMTAADADLATRQLAEDLPGNSSGAADFRLARSATGQIALVWQDASEDRVDMWSAFYDPVVHTWSLQQRLTQDDRMEHSMAPTFDASGDLVVAYDKVQTVYETRTVTVGGQPVQVQVPVPDQTDLYFLRHTISGDLAVFAPDVMLNPPNPMAGQSVTISAKMKNIGDKPASNIAVSFYDGNPSTGGSLIGSQTIAGPLVGGSDATVSVQWTAPSTTAPRNIYVVVDPNQVQEDRDRTNNTAVVTGVMKPDLVIESIQVQNAGPRHRIVTARVVNLGSLTVNSTDVAVRRDSQTGPLLTTLNITDPLAPGAFHDVSWFWENPPGGQRQIELYAIVDEADTVAEFDESNNARAGTVPTLLLGDLDADGYISAGDIDFFVNVLLGLDADPYRAAAADMDSSGNANGVDIPMFVNALLTP